jgi:hypothetical protein
LRISNLSSGNYKLLINFPGGKYPAQTFNCVVGNGDESYTLKNMGQGGWVLKNIKNNKAVTAVNALWDDEPEGRSAAKQGGAFGEMLAQVADDSDLLKPTVWVYTAKPEAGGDEDSAGTAQAEPDTAAAYATKGVIKVSEEDTANGKAMVFYAFDAKGGDTIHLVVPSAKTAGNTPPDTSLVAKNDTSAKAAGNAPVNLVQPPAPAADSTATNKQEVAKINIPVQGINDDTLLAGRAHKVLNDTAAVFDTSAGKQVTNPFFKRQDNTGGVSAPANNSTAQLQVPPAEPPAPAAGTNKEDTVVAVNSNPAAVDTAAPKVMNVREGCEKQLSDNAFEKLKHKIYLERDERKMADIATKNISGKCISTEQVKSLASFFSSDDSRLNFFKAVYPFVYDYSHFTILESYMIDKNYKEMFRASFK